MQTSANTNKSQPQNAIPRPERSQDKGPKFEAFFSSAMVGLDRRSKAAARHCDQKR